MSQALHDRFEHNVIPLIDDAYTLARHLLHDEHDAQDVVQEAYLRAWRFYASFRGGDERAWLLTIVRHCCYTWRRGRHHAERVTFDEEQHGMDASSFSAADSRAIDESERENLAAALDRLPQEFREVLVLRELQELSYKEIARVTGVPVGTVMSRLARARDRLRRVLKRTA
ncbi:MAG TPA: sigma-70 family RNA polymerase sigma factor [Gemmatimonadaceae bacterium]|nr:sigma-70 family RNA polymerase sigma factor [Gemmatimonadaceae bacterium]